MPKRILYVLDIFPKLQESFIRNELLGLLKLGVEVRIWALSAQKNRLAYLESSTLLPFVVSRELGLAHGKRRVLRALLFAFCHPFRFLKALALSAYSDSPDGLLVLVQCCGAAAKLRNMNIDHIHAHYAGRPTKHAMLLSILTRIPYSFTTHIPQALKGHVRRRRDFYLKGKYATKVVTTTSINMEHLAAKVKIPRDKIVVVPCAVDASVLKPPGNHSLTSRVILNVARLEPIKGHSILLKACGLLKERNVDFRCKIVGEGSTKEDLVSAIKQFGLESNVCLLGAVSNAERDAELRNAAVFAMPSFFEGLGVAALEAMACEVPVVASRVGGLIEVVEDGRTGFLVEPGNPEELANKIALLLDNIELAQRMGREGRKRVLEYFETYQISKKMAAALGYI